MNSSTAWHTLPQSRGQSSRSYIATTLSSPIFDRGLFSFVAILGLAVVALDAAAKLCRYHAVLRRDMLKTPPVWPYVIPVVGSVATGLSYLLASSPVDWVLSHRYVGNGGFNGDTTKLS